MSLYQEHPLILVIVVSFHLVSLPLPFLLLSGDVDPWHILGTYRTFPSSSQSDAFLITGTAHCADLYPARSQDLPSLTNARVQQNALLGQWLKNGNPSQQKRQPEEAKILIE